MKTEKLIKNTIIAVCALAITSPLFIAETLDQVVSENDHLVSSLYRSIASVKEDNKDQVKDKEVTLCENKKKIEDLSKEIEKLQKQKDKVTKIVAKLEGKDSEKDAKDSSEHSSEDKKGFSKDTLSQLLMQQIYLNNMLAGSLMTQQRPQGNYFGDALWINTSNSGNMSSSQLNNYASMALYNQLAFKMQSNQMWSPQFNQQGSLSNAMYDVGPSNPYSNNYVNLGQRLGMNSFNF